MDGKKTAMLDQDLSLLDKGDGPTLDMLGDLLAVGDDEMGGTFDIDANYSVETEAA